MYQPPTSAQIDKLVLSSLEEDIGAGDITSRSVIDPQQTISAEVITREPITLCGLEIFCAVFIYLDQEMTFSGKIFKDGDSIEKNHAIIKVHGKCQAMLAGERTALNILQMLSGIATLTREYVEKARPVTVLDTRKTTPGLRTFEKYAVRCGGGTNHRFGLFDAILIKDNHIKSAGSIGEAVKRAKEKIPADMMVEVETASLTEVEEALRSGAQRILLDNMTLATIRQAVSMIKGNAQVEVSGGVSLEDLDGLSNTGIDFVSVGALTHSARAVDLSMNFY